MPDMPGFPEVLVNVGLMVLLEARFPVDLLLPEGWPPVFTEELSRALLDRPQHKHADCPPVHGGEVCPALSMSR